MGRALLRVAEVEHSFRADATARRTRRSRRPSPRRFGRARGGDRAPHRSHRVHPYAHLPSRIIAVMAFDLVKFDAEKSAAPGCSERK